MTLREIVKQYLKQNGYDGLVHPDSECGCGLDDLWCTEHCPGDDCEPAYEVQCSKCGETVYSKTKDSLDGCCICGGEEEGIEL